MIISELNRQTEKYVIGKWARIQFKDLLPGDVFRLWEYKGFATGDNGLTEWVASSHPAKDCMTHVYSIRCESVKQNST